MYSCKVELHQINISSDVCNLPLYVHKCNDLFIGLEEYIVIICNLPILLAERRMKVSDLIRGTGINKTTLHKLYNDELTRIDFETINRICDFLDIDVGDLLSFKKNSEE